jgi:hypothetical protein
MAITFPFFFFLIKYGVGDLAYWFFLIFSHGLRLARLVSFFMTQPTNHGFTLDRLVHSRSGVILKRLGLFGFAFLIVQSLTKVSHFLLLTTHSP